MYSYISTKAERVEQARIPTFYERSKEDLYFQLP